MPRFSDTTSVSRSPSPAIVGKGTQRFQAAHPSSGTATFSPQCAANSSSACAPPAMWFCMSDRTSLSQYNTVRQSRTMALSKLRKALSSNRKRSESHKLNRKRATPFAWLEKPDACSNRRCKAAWLCACSSDDIGRISSTNVLSSSRLSWERFSIMDLLGVVHSVTRTKQLYRNT